MKVRAQIAACALAMLAGCSNDHAVIDAGSDAGVSCVAVAPPTSNVSSGCALGYPTPCDAWAASLTASATPGGVALARCVVDAVDAGPDDSPHMRCAAADRCTVDPSGGARCYCGESPECAAGAACMRVDGASRCVACL